MTDNVDHASPLRSARSKLMPAALLAILCLLCACSSVPFKSDDSKVAMDAVGTGAVATDAVATNALSTESRMPVAPVLPATDHFQAAMQFLQDGKPQRADEEFHVYLQMVPDSKSAQILVAQIETPLDMLFPADNFVVKLAKNDTLSSLAKVYLGDALQFYALARYNGISVPASIREGQAIEIRKRRQPLPLSRGKGPRARILQAPAGVGTGEKPSVDAYYQDGLIAFQRQDLDSPSRIGTRFWLSIPTIEMRN